MEIKKCTQVGCLDLIAGPMYAGKTTELLRRLFNEAEVGLKVLCINHSSDNRSKGPFSTHNPLYKKKLSEESKVSFISTPLLKDIDEMVKGYDTIGIDESQFFPDLVSEVTKYVDVYGKHVIVSGLSGNFKREMFGEILKLEPLADSYTKLYSYCKNCAKDKIKTMAIFTHKFETSSQKIIDVGGKEKYIPVCRKCYLKFN